MKTLIHRQARHFWPHFRNMEISVDLAKVVEHLGLLIANVALLTRNASILCSFHIISFHKYLNPCCMLDSVIGVGLK